jgi:hypothetical protein
MHWIREVIDYKSQVSLKDVILRYTLLSNNYTKAPQNTCSIKKKPRKTITKPVGPGLSYSYEPPDAAVENSR